MWLTIVSLRSTARNRKSATEFFSDRKNVRKPIEIHGTTNTNESSGSQAIDQDDGNATQIRICQELFVMG
jgi:hypothetical protein